MEAAGPHDSMRAWTRKTSPRRDRGHRGAQGSRPCESNAGVVVEKKICDTEKKRGLGKNYQPLLQLFVKEKLRLLQKMDRIREKKKWHGPPAPVIGKSRRRQKKRGATTLRSGFTASHRPFAN